MTDLVISELPQRIDIKVSAGSNFSSSIDFDFNTTGYTVTAYVNYGLPDQQAFTVAVVSLALGQYTISLTAAQITALGSGSHKWYLHYTNGTTSRRAFSGVFLIIDD
jgi:hypothetical protein